MHLEQYYHHAKFDFYHMSSVQEYDKVKAFDMNEQAYTNDYID